MDVKTIPHHLLAAAPAKSGESQGAAAMSREADLRNAAEGFEALFLHQVIKSSRNASLGEALGASSATETAQSMLDTKLSDIGAGRAGLGLADAIYQQFAGHRDRRGGL